MLKTLSLDHVGPSDKLEMAFNSRLNLLTGDNGLGKSFLLDTAWWALTGAWPVQVNPALLSGRKALPTGSAQASISFSYTTRGEPVEHTCLFDYTRQAWQRPPALDAAPGLVLYAMVDGSFAIWDPARNGYVTPETKRPPAYVFTPAQLWNGLRGPEENWLCNGLVRDWASWQKERGEAFEHLKKALITLSPSDEERFRPGKLTRISLDDARDMPTIIMPYAQEVPVVHASAGIRRMLALAYALIWAWSEHERACALIRRKPSDTIVFLVDEIESHLHPRWQFRIVESLLHLMGDISKHVKVQLITATHSPMVLSSVEPYFDATLDAWFDMDYVPGTRDVALSRCKFEKRGDVSNWLTSQAFKLSSATNPAQARLMQQAAELLDEEEATPQQGKMMYERLLGSLSGTDPFLLRFYAIAKRKGWFA